MGSIGILSSVVGRGGSIPSVAVLSSGYRRTVYDQRRVIGSSWGGTALTATLRRGGGRTSDMRGDKYSTLRSAPRSVRGGGEASEPGQQAVRVGGGGAAASAGGRGDRGAVRPPRVLPRGGQGAGQVRDAARAPARRGVGDRVGGRARLLPGRVLPGRGGVRSRRDGRAAGRQTRPPQPVKLTDQIVGSCRPHRRTDPAPSWPRRSPTGSGWYCTGAPWNGPDGGEHRCARLARSPVLAGRRGGAGDYEVLRAHVLATGATPDSLTAARVTRRGVAGLIAWPSAEPVFHAALLGAHRPPWTPHHDPRLDALADAFALLLDTGRAGPAAPTATLTDMINDMI